eukprot:14907317-Alexandrium_andersonii.AAC.1
MCAPRALVLTRCTRARSSPRVRARRARVGVRAARPGDPGAQPRSRWRVPPANPLPRDLAPCPSPPRIPGPRPGAFT